MLLADCTDLRDLLAGVLDGAGATGLHPDAVFAAALAFEALIDPLQPPPPWRPRPLTVPVTGLRAARDRVLAEIDRPRPVGELLALAEASRHLEEALHETGSAGAGRR